MGCFQKSLKVYNLQTAFGSLSQSLIVGPEFVAACVDGSGQVNGIRGFEIMLCSQLSRHVANSVGVHEVPPL
jgi:hypothetical protein